MLVLYDYKGGANFCMTWPGSCLLLDVCGATDSFDLKDLTCFGDTMDECTTVFGTWLYTCRWKYCFSTKGAGWLIASRFLELLTTLTMVRLLLILAIACGGLPGVTTGWILRELLWLREWKLWKIWFGIASGLNADSLFVSELKCISALAPASAMKFVFFTVSQFDRLGVIFINSDDLRVPFWFECIDVLTEPWFVMLLLPFRCLIR